MADDVEIRFDRAALEELLNSPNGPMATELSRMGQQVERHAKQICAVDTGRLRASIFWVLGRDGQGLFVIIGSNVVYAIWVELGTETTPAQPYLRPALAAVAGATSAQGAQP